MKALYIIIIMTVLAGCGNRQWDVSDIDVRGIVVTERSGYCFVKFTSIRHSGNRWCFPNVDSYEIDGDIIYLTAAVAELGDDVGCCLGQKTIDQVLLPKDAFSNNRLLYLKNGNNVVGPLSFLYVSDAK